MSQRAREAVIAYYSSVTDDEPYPPMNELEAAFARLEAEALERGARAMQEAAVKWLHDAIDEAAEELGNRLFEINRDQKTQNVFTAQPYFDAIAAAILALSSTDVTKGLSDADT